MKILKRIIQFFREVKSELKKVTWPTRKEAIRWTILVIVVSLIVAAIIGVFDFLFLYLMEKIILRG